MDSGVAALLGAGIGGLASLLGGFFGPWIRDAATRRSMRREAAEDAIRENVVGAIEAFGKLLKAHQSGAPIDEGLHIAATIGISRVAVLLKPDDVDVSEAMARALNTIDSGSPAGATAMSVIQAVLPEWIRGELKGEHVLARYEEGLVTYAEFTVVEKARRAAEKALREEQEAAK